MKAFLDISTAGTPGTMPSVVLMLLSDYARRECLIFPVTEENETRCGPRSGVMRKEFQSIDLNSIGM
jgi:hypothetical protein